MVEQSVRQWTHDIHVSFPGKHDSRHPVQAQELSSARLKTVSTTVIMASAIHNHIDTGICSNTSTNKACSILIHVKVSKQYKMSKQMNIYCNMECQNLQEVSVTFTYVSGVYIGICMAQHHTASDVCSWSRYDRKEHECVLWYYLRQHRFVFINIGISFISCLSVHQLKQLIMVVKPHHDLQSTINIPQTHKTTLILNNNSKMKFAFIFSINESI